MSLILTSRHGYVTVLEDPGVPGVICLDYPKTIATWPAFEDIKCIITRVQLQLPENFQFQHAVGGQIYLYTFGSRIGEVTVTGLAFGQACADGPQCGAQGAAVESHGIDELVVFYKSRRVSVSSSAIVVALGKNTCFNGYMVGLFTDVLDPKIDLYQFSMRLHVDPGSINCP